MKKIIFLSLFILEIIVISLPTKPSIASPQDKTVIRIGKNSWANKDLIELINTLPPEIRNNAHENPKEFIKILARNSVLSDYARNYGLDHDPIVQRQRAWFENGVLSQAARRDILEKTTVTSKEIDSFYKDHSIEYTDFVFRVAVIRINSNYDPSLTSSQPDSRAVAQDIYDKVKHGASLDQAAQAHSNIVMLEKADEPTDNIGLNLPVVVRDMAASLKLGELSRPFQTEGGWTLIQLVERHDLPQNVARDQIEARLRQEKSEEKINELLKNSNVIFDDKSVSNFKP